RYTAQEAPPGRMFPSPTGRGAARVAAPAPPRVWAPGPSLIPPPTPAPPAPPAGLAKLPIQTIAGATAGIAHRWNRFELALNGAFDRDEWGNSTLTDGTILSNKDRNYNQYAGNARAGYELWPGVKPFVDVVVDTRVHDAV